MQTKICHYHFCVSATTPSYISQCSQNIRALPWETNVNNCVSNGVLLRPPGSSSRVCFHYERNRLESNRWLPQGNNAGSPCGSRPGKATPARRTRNRERSSARGRGAAASASASLPPADGPNSGRPPPRSPRASGPRRRRGQERALPRGPRRPRRRGAERGPGAVAPGLAPRRGALARPAALPVRAGGGVARETPPRPRHPAARRAREATPSRTGPGARAYFFPQRVAAASSPGRPQRRPRAPDSPGGCWCWPWAPPGRHGPRSDRPLRSQRTATEPEPMGRPHPPPVTSPTTIPALRHGQDFRAVRSLIGGATCYSRASPDRASPSASASSAKLSMRSFRGDAAGFSSCREAERGEGGRRQGGLPSLRLALTSGFVPRRHSAVGATAWWRQEGAGDVGRCLVPLRGVSRRTASVPLTLLVAASAWPCEGPLRAPGPCYSHELGCIINAISVQTFAPKNLPSLEEMHDPCAPWVWMHRFRRPVFLCSLGTESSLSLVINVPAKYLSPFLKLLRGMRMRVGSVR